MVLYICMALLGISILACMVLLILDRIDKKKAKAARPETTNLHLNLDPVHKAIEAIPNKVLQSIVSKNSNHRGDLGELISFIKLGAMYDRVIPMNNIVDFIGIKLPNDTTEGYIDFIDAKTGKGSLSKEQKALRKLIEEKKIGFVKLKIDVNTGPDSGDDNS